MRALPLLPFLASALVAAPPVQSPWAPWKTLDTAHTRIHYPARGGFEPFAQEVAARIDGIHSRVLEAVGHGTPRRVEILIQDPLRTANGMAVPLLDAPHVVLWRTPPESDDSIGHIHDWVELLVTHELVHIHHLARPQHRPDWRDRLLDLPVGPLVRKSPRWLIEGYATLLEGRITGTGRPHSPYRAAVLRQWALQGRLPAYGALSNSRDYLGGSMAYLVGSAFLGWLERTHPESPDILRTLWRQLASARRRGFEACFRATFGRDAPDAYARFVAETTHGALEFERRMKQMGLEREGDLVMRLPGDAEDLAVSPDGRRLAAVLRQPKGSGLVVWDLEAKPKTGKSPEAPDPDEPEDRDPGWSPLPVAGRLPRWNGILPERPEWIGNEALALRMRMPDAEGVLQWHSARWPLRGAPLPERAPSALEPMASGPFLRPILEGKRWRLRWKGVDVPLPGEPAGRAVVDPARRVLHAACTVEGVWNLVEIPFEEEGGRPRFLPARRLTRTLSAVWNPAPTPDGKHLYYTRLAAGGLELRRLDLGRPPLDPAPLPTDPVPVAPDLVFPAPDATSRIPPAGEIPPARDYSIWETHLLRGRSGIVVGPSGESIQAGVGGADLLGRLGWRLLGSFGKGAGPRGATFGFRYDGWRLAPTLEVFSSLERPSRQAFLPRESLDVERRGASLAFTARTQGNPATFHRLAIGWERNQPLATDAIHTRRLIGLAGGLAGAWSRGDSWGWSLRARGEAQAGRTDGKGWKLTRGEAQLGFQTPAFTLRLAVEGGAVHGEPTPLDRFRLGGSPNPLAAGPLAANHLVQPALPAWLQTGTRVGRARADIGGSLHVYLEHLAAWDGSRGPAQRILGVEWTLDPLPAYAERIVGRVSLTAGIHRPLDGPMKQHTVATLNLLVRP